MDQRISIHHIGGRDGNSSFPLPSQFQQDFVLTLYDADADCIDQIKERNQYLKSEVRVLPYCIGKSSGQATLHINYDPYTSSLFPANPAYRDYRVISNYGAFGREFDYVFGEVLRPMEKRAVTTVSLDELLRQNRLGPAPDFLSIDTQGSEYEILSGAAEVLQSTLAVVLEVEFHPMYCGQKLFGDLCELLARQGFLFVGFSDKPTLWSPGRTPISLRGEGVLLCGDALFIRSVESLGKGRDQAARAVILKKLAFLAVVFNQVELAVEALRAAEAAEDGKAVESLKSLEYGRFIDEFWAAAKTQGDFYPATFCSQFSFEASRGRFATAGQRGQRWLERIRDWCVRKPARWQGLKAVLQPISATGRRVELFGKLLGAGKPFWRHPAFQWRTQVERVLRRYGLDEQEKIVRRNRRKHAPFCEQVPPAAAEARGPSARIPELERT